MNKLRQSYDGLKNIVTNVIAFVAGNNDENSESSLSSGEVVECNSDCSQCQSDSEGSISMNSSSRHEGASKGSQASKLAVEDLVQSLQQNSAKRRKINSSSSGSIEEEKDEQVNLKASAKVDSKRGMLTLLITFLVEGAQPVTIVHRKRKFNEISGLSDHMNRSQANPSMGQQIIEHAPILDEKEGKRNSAHTVMEVRKSTQMMAELSIHEQK